MNNDRLTKIGLNYKTDKALYHQFTPIYHQFFEPIKDSVQSILEIGIYNGSSLRTWNDYFKNARIYGADIDHSCLFSTDRIKTCFVNQADRSSLEQMVKTFQVESFDIIIDDGGHTMEQQQITFATLFKYLKNDGHYIIEDLQTSYWQEYGVNDLKKTTLGVLKSFLESGHFDSPYLSRNENEDLSKLIKSIKIFDTKKDFESITSVIRKKSLP